MFGVCDLTKRLKLRGEDLGAFEDVVGTAALCEGFASAEIAGPECRVGDIMGSALRRQSRRRSREKKRAPLQVSKGQKLVRQSCGADTCRSKVSHDASPTPAKERACAASYNPEEARN